MSTPNPPPDEPSLREPPDFSLVLGGPLYQLWRRARLAGDDTQQLLKRRILVLALFAWAPLLVLSAGEGHLRGGSVELPFLHDIDMHVRLLLALPLLILAEQVVNQRMRPVMHQFVARRLIPDTARDQFDAAILSAMRLRNSIAAEVLLLALVYGVGVAFLWRTQIALDATSWYGSDVAGTLHPSLAGWWLGCISLPMFQFLLLRWYFRLFVWARFLWHVSRIQLRLMPTHPDHCGGLGFLASCSNAFAPVLFAQGAVLAGLISNRIFHAGATLPEFQLELAGMVGVVVLAILGPMLVFVPQLAACKRIGTGEYGLLAQRYAREFDHKWLRGGAPDGEPLLGSADLQSLADLGTSFAVVKQMQWAPFYPRTGVQLAVITLLPVAPLLLTMIPLEELLARMLSVVF